MKFLDYLKEEYETTLKNMEGLPFTVYKNPSKDDFKDLMVEMKRNNNSAAYFARFLVDNEHNNIFVWDAFIAVHPDVIPYLQKHYKLGKTQRTDRIADIAPIKNYKLYYPKLTVHFNKDDYGWLEPYMDY